MLNKKDVTTEGFLTSFVFSATEPLFLTMPAKEVPTPIIRDTNWNLVGGTPQKT